MTVKTGTVEPTWPTTEGGLVIEYSMAGAVVVVPPPVEDPAPPKLPPGIGDRYGGGYWRNINDLREMQ
ncbi:hypothetical protein MASR1M8_15900 [Thermomonas brevis]